MYSTPYVSWVLQPQCFFGYKELQEQTWPFQPEWQSRAGLMVVTFRHALSSQPGQALSGFCSVWPESRGGGTGEEEVGSCFWHVCISKTRGEDDKRITVDVFSLLNDTHVMLPHIVAFTDQSVFWKVIVFYLRVSVLLLFCSLSSTQSSFLYYFIAVSESHPPPPPLFLSLFFYPFPPSSSLPPSLPLPIFACATFNCSDMPCGKLCLCALQQALLVIAVVPDVRGGLQILVAKPHSIICCMRIVVYSTMSSEPYTKPSLRNINN